MIDDGDRTIAAAQRIIREAAAKMRPASPRPPRQPPAAWTWLRANPMRAYLVAVCVTTLVAAVLDVVAKARALKRQT